MVETRSAKVGLHQGDETACLAGPTRGTKTLAIDTAEINSCVSISKVLHITSSRDGGPCSVCPVKVSHR